MRAAWLKAISKSFPQGHVPSFPSYPLLGAELPPATEVPRRGGEPWRIRLALVGTFDAAQFSALTEDVEEVRLVGEARELRNAVNNGPDLFLEEGAGEPSDAWILTASEAAPIGPLQGWRRAWRRGEEARLEHTLVADKMLLRNLALLHSLPARNPEVDLWAVSSSLSAVEDAGAEALIGDTLAYLTGVVGGANLLEVAQQPAESFDTLWARLSILRLLRWEAALAQPGDLLAGAGLFAELAAR